MFNKILVCSDGSEAALKAARAAAEIAKKFDSRVVLLNVFTPSPSTMTFVGAPDAVPYAQMAVGYADEVQEAVELRTGRIFDEMKVAYEGRREMGHPVDRIVGVAEEEQVDLIVMGSRGLGGFQRILLGSVSDGVLHHAHCPVLIVR